MLPYAREVRAKDKIQGGVAVMASDLEISVHPYTFREVCRNGAIMAQTLQTHKIARLPLDAPTETITEVLSEVRAVVRECAEPEVFSKVADRLRRAAMTRADLALNWLPMLLSHTRGTLSPRIVTQIMSRFTGEGDATMFGLMNAVTSVARDQPDPQVRWDLEELGGSVPSLVRPTPKPDFAAADLVGTSW